MKINFELFPTLVSYHRSFLNKNQAKEIFDFCMSYKKTSYHQTFLNTNGVSSDTCGKHRDHILEEISRELNSCEDLLKRIQYSFDEYCVESGIKNVIIEKSWFNIQNENSVLENHVHGQSVISCGLYVNMDDKSSKVFFENQNTHVAMNNVNNGDILTKFSHTYYSFLPEPGDLIIFPSWLKHGSNGTKNMTKNRIVISANSIF